MLDSGFRIRDLSSKYQVLVCFLTTIEVVSKSQIATKLKARADEKAQHTRGYVSILRRSATLRFGVRCVFETASNILTNIA